MKESERQNHSGYLVRQQEQGVPGRPLLLVFGVAVGIGVLAVACSSWLLWSAYGFVGDENAQKGSSALETGRITEVAPGLDKHRQARRKLSEFGWVDRPAGVVSIPIEEAMNAMANGSARRLGLGGAAGDQEAGP